MTSRYPNTGAEVVQVIRTTLTHRGDGSEANPNRYVTQYWSLDGELLAEVDPAQKPGRES